MDLAFETAFGLLGGLALFLFGMNMMSEGLQKAAGEKMRSVLSMLTANPLLGVLAGAIATAVLQSSSATTVMVIGFVSAGIMGLPQAIAVIFGANIGTTMTAQLLAFKLSDFIWIIVFIGFFVWFAFKDERIKNIGQTVFAFGLLFVGIETMGDVMKPLADSPVFMDMIAQVKDIPALGVLVGAVMTLVVQSSSATIAVLQNFASQPGPDGASVLGLAGSIPILLGDNIGTTITALLASVGQSRDAKRAAVAHSVFNISGAFLFVWLIPLLVQFITFITPGPELDVISRQIANTHTTFNVLCTLIWTPLIPIMVRIVSFIVPSGKGGEDDGKLVHLERGVITQPVFAIKMLEDELRVVMARMRTLLPELTEAIKTRDQKLIKRAESECQRVQAAEEELMAYMAEMFSAGFLTEAQAAETTDLMLVTDSVGRISRRSNEALGLVRDNLKAKKPFTDEAYDELVGCAETVSSIYDAVLEFMRNRDDSVEDTLSARRRQLIKQQNKVRKGHFQRVSSKECPKESRASFEALLLCFERASNECFSLAERDSQLLA